MMAASKTSAEQSSAAILSSGGENIDVSHLKSGEIPGVDGLRAVSILLVLVAFLRLQPELFAYVLLSALIGFVYFGMPRFSNFAAALLYVTNYYDISVSGLKEPFTIRWAQLWSLAVEEHYYLTYPILFAATIRTPKRLLAIMIAICGILLAWRCVLVWNGVFQPHTYMATDTRLDSIAYGCLGALILLRFNAALVPFARWFKLALPLGLSMVLVGTLVTSPVFRETARYSLQGIGFLLIFLGLFTPWGRMAVVFLEMSPMRWMGRMSYAAYLWGSEYQACLYIKMAWGPKWQSASLPNYTYLRRG